MESNIQSDEIRNKKIMLKVFSSINQRLQQIGRDVEVWEFDVKAFEPDTQPCVFSIVAGDEYPKVVLDGANEAEMCLSEMMECKNITLDGSFLLWDYIWHIGR